jgi:hypothetical protein
MKSFSGGWILNFIGKKGIIYVHESNNEDEILIHINISFTVNLRESRLLERLRKEREAKIQELKEMANYYMAKRHIQVSFLFLDFCCVNNLQIISPLFCIVILSNYVVPVLLATATAKGFHF